MTTLCLSRIASFLRPSSFQEKRARLSRRKSELLWRQGLNDVESHLEEQGDEGDGNGESGRSSWNSIFVPDTTCILDPQSVIMVRWAACVLFFTVWTAVGASPPPYPRITHLSESSGSHRPLF